MKCLSLSPFGLGDDPSICETNVRHKGKDVWMEEPNNFTVNSCGSCFRSTSNTIPSACPLDLVDTYFLEAGHISHGTRDSLIERSMDQRHLKTYCSIPALGELWGVLTLSHTDCYTITMELQGCHQGERTLTCSSNIPAMAVILIHQRQWCVWESGLLSLPSERTGRQEEGTEELFSSHPVVYSSYYHSMLVHFINDVVIAKTFSMHLWASSILSFWDSINPTMHISVCAFIDFSVLCICLFIQYVSIYICFK